MPGAGPLSSLVAASEWRQGCERKPEESYSATWLSCCRGKQPARSPPTAPLPPRVLVLLRCCCVPLMGRLVVSHFVRGS